MRVVHLFLLAFHDIPAANPLQKHGSKLVGIGLASNYPTGHTN